MNSLDSIAVAVIIGFAMITLAVVRYAKSFGQYTESFHEYIHVVKTQTAELILSREESVKVRSHEIRMHEENRTAALANRHQAAENARVALELTALRDTMKSQYNPHSDRERTA